MGHLDQQMPNLLWFLTCPSRGIRSRRVTRLMRMRSGSLEAMFDSLVAWSEGLSTQFGRDVVTMTLIRGTATVGGNSGSAQAPPAPTSPIV